MMEKRKPRLTADAALALYERRWPLVVLAVWLIFCAWFVYNKWDAIRFFSLSDTDDNMRIAQVRALLHGQGWFDLRQYRLNPPFGANIHWSRLVDLPIAGLILLLRPFVGGPHAELAAVAIAPLLPYLLLLFSVALLVRRLVDPRAYALAFISLFFAGSTNGMFMPERIDHHGWQLAFLLLSAAAMADPKRLRGGITLGIATALSLAIGMEMLIYLAIAGAALVLFWVVDRREAERLGAYAVTVSGATALAYLAFASYANRQPVCDALSPVWLSDALLGGALLLLLARVSPTGWRARLLLAIGAGILLAAFHALMWPHCLQRLEGVSPEVERLWLSHVREARPIYLHGWRIALIIVALPVTGVLGWATLVWRNRIEPELFRRTLASALMAITAAALLLWQTRTGPASQALAVTGTAALVWVLGSRVLRIRNDIVQMVAATLVVVIGLGAMVPLVMDHVPNQPPTPREVAIGKANRLCNTLWGFRPVALQPKGIVFTFVDLGPRVIAVTHHDSITGPYHRNGQQIADVMNAFRGSADQAHAIIAKYRADYLLTCPNNSTTTIFMGEAPKGFYAQLQRGQVPAWLEPVALPADSPFRMWRVLPPS